MERLDFEFQRTARIKTAKQWETDLARHYLRSDGPFGASSLSFIDATPEQLALASGRTTACADEALQSFVSIFDLRDVRLALSSGTPKTFSDCEGPGWIRYLLLTCVVAAAPSEISPSNDFRQRLQAVLGWSSQLVGLGGTAILWERLVAWCDQKRLDGEPYRAIVLPDPGGWRQIGHSLRIAFPSRADRRRLGAILSERENISSPRALIALVRRRFDSEIWSDAFRGVFLDFETRYRNGDRLLAEHAFWRLVSDLPSTPRANRTVLRKMRLRMIRSIDQNLDLELEANQDECIGSDGWDQLPDGRAAISGSVDEIFEVVRQQKNRGHLVISQLVADVARGLVPFVETTWGTWDWHHDPEPHSVRVLASDATKLVSPKNIDWHPVAPGWHISNVLPFAQLREAFCVPEQADIGDHLRALRLQGGVRTMGQLLGIPGVFPTIATSAHAEIALQSVRVERGALSARLTDLGVVEFSSSQPVDGVWKLSISEHSQFAPTEMILRFVDRAIEHVEIAAPDLALWPQENDVEQAELLASHEIRALSYPARPDDRLYHLLEAIYAEGHASWAEADLVPLIQVFSGRGPSPWDILRALQEGGFLVPHVSARWRARRWHLSPPQLYSLGKLVVLDGAICQTMRERFLRVVTKNNGHPTVHYGVGAWSVPLLSATGVDIHELAEVLETKRGSPPVYTFASAPMCWRQSIHDTQFRDPVSTWNWKQGCFASTASDDSDVRLQRWSRSKRDAQDIYTIERLGKPTATIATRTAAVVEAYRCRNEALFKRSGNLLCRLSAAGWLPDQAALRLRLSHLSSPGPVAVEGHSRGYAYPCDPMSNRWLSRQFGAAVDLLEHELSFLDAALARRLPGYGRLLRAQGGRRIRR